MFPAIILPRMRRILVPSLMLAWGLSAIAIAGHRHDRCPDCGNALCVPSFEPVKEKKHCWQVECKKICIPHIRLPWQSCCELPKCGWVRNVKVLKKVEYECEKCGCKWDVKCLDCPPASPCRD